MKPKRLIFILLLLAALLLPAAVQAESPAPQPEPERISIALIDTGIDLDKGLLDSDRIRTGVNYAFPEQDTDDLIGHGTRIAGLLLGTTDGKIQGAGPDALLVPLVYYSKYPSGVVKNGGVEALCAAIYAAIDDYGCQVVNLSSGIIEDDPQLRDAAAYAEEAGVILVSAAGNSNKDYPGQLTYPAAYDTVIGTGSADETLAGPAAFSQRGPGLTLLAPGTNLTVPGIRNARDYETVEGTSYSAAYVSGLAASLLARWPEMTPADFREILAESCRDLNTPGYDTDTGWGLLDPAAALSAAARLLGDQPPLPGPEAFAKARPAAIQALLQSARAVAGQ